MSRATLLTPGDCLSQHLRPSPGAFLLNSRSRFGHPSLSSPLCILPSVHLPVTSHFRPAPCSPFWTMNNTGFRGRRSLEPLFCLSESELESQTHLPGFPAPVPSATSPPALLGQRAGLLSLPCTRHTSATGTLSPLLGTWSPSEPRAYSPISSRSLPRRHLSGRVSPDTFI